MPSFEEYRLQRTGRPDHIHLDEPRRAWPWLVLLLIVAGAVGWFAWVRYGPVSYTHLTLPTILLV